MAFVVIGSKDHTGALGTYDVSCDGSSVPYTFTKMSAEKEALFCQCHSDPSAFPMPPDDDGAVGRRLGDVEEDHPTMYQVFERHPEIPAVAVAMSFAIGLIWLMLLRSFAFAITFATLGIV